MPTKVSGVTSSQSAAAAKGGAGQRPAASGTSQAVGTASSGTSTSAAAGATSGATPSASDSVAITDTASHLVTAELGLAEVPVINPGRVAQVRGALESGTYRVSSERIANKLLQYDRLLPGNPLD